MVILLNALIGAFLAMTFGFAQPSSSSEQQTPAGISPYYCRAFNLPTTWAFDNPPGAIEHNAVAFTEEGMTSPTIVYRNRRGLAVARLMMVMEYLDDKAQTVERVPLAVSITGQQHRPLPFHAERVITLSRTIPPGETAEIGTVSDGTRTGVCPATARITFISVQFANGATENKSAPDWKLDPIPRSIPPVPKTLYSSIPKQPNTFLTKVSIDASGRVIDTAPLNSEQTGLPLWVRSWMQQSWQYYPALIDGRPSPAVLLMAIQVHTERTYRFPETQPFPRPVVLIRLFPDAHNDSAWEVHYGSLDQFSTIR